MPLGLTLYPRGSNPLLANDFPRIFADYVDVVFARLGDRVKSECSGSGNGLIVFLWRWTEGWVDGVADISF